MALVNLTGRETHRWAVLEDDAPVPPDARVLVSLARFARAGAELRVQAKGLGVVLRSDEAAEDLALLLDGLDIIALDFPAFGDGRAFSKARRLRDQFGYQGELRAIGETIPDQALFLARCGFDTIALPARFTYDHVKSALAAYTTWYQPASDERPNVLHLRQADYARRQAS